MWATYDWKKKELLELVLGCHVGFSLFFPTYFVNILMEQLYLSNIGLKTTTTFVSYCVDMMHFLKSFYL